MDASKKLGKRKIIESDDYKLKGPKQRRQILNPDTDVVPEDTTSTVQPLKEIEDPLISTDDNMIFCWGHSANGALGLGDIEEQNVPLPREIKFSVGSTVKSVRSGASHTLVLLHNGHLYSCGDNKHGQLGHEKSGTKLQLIEALVPYKIIAIACGENHSLALEQWGQIFSWGSDSHGQLGGNSGESFILKPKVIKTLGTSNIVQIACGHKHSMALTNKSELYSWGLNESGQLGLGGLIRIVPTPTYVSSLMGLPISFIACGAYHSMILSKSGAVFGCGMNTSGQLGQDFVADHSYPVQLKTLRSIKVKYICCGDDFTVFLTQEGGVLTCGEGEDGQLGHGSVTTEFLPRKIIELMGSTVTQIACGGKHVLAFVPSQNKVFSFGLGKNGQLGIDQKLKKISNSYIPVAVQGPWLSGKSFVEEIYSGGDHCFVTVTAKKKPSDFRIQPPETKIWTVTIEKMIECQNVSEKDTVDQDLMTYLETVLASQGCVNGSFLLPNEQHYCCTVKNTGIDLDLAKNCFSAISKSSNPTIRDVCLEAVSTTTLNLPESPPDIETLRLYITLPLYHEFDNARHSAKLQGPFSIAFNELKPEAAKILGAWYLTSSEEYFERLVRIFQNVVTVLLRGARKADKSEQVVQLSRCDETIEQCLDMLASLNRINSTRPAENTLSYEIFYLPEILDIIDVRVDYITWALEKNNPAVKVKNKYFCDYPFIFDPHAKTLLLQTDQSHQMHNAMTQAAQQALENMLFSPIPLPVNAFLELHVTRTNIVEDTIRELSNYHETEYKKPLKIQFLGEEAEDAGGVRKEFFLLLIRELLDPKYGMFRSDPESNAIWFSEDTFEDESMYYLVGLLCGLAIYNFTIINLPFPLALYKKILNERMNLQDLKDLFPSLASGLQSLLDYEGDDVEDVFALQFEVQRSSYGQIITTELKPGGSHIAVNKENKKEYVDLYVRHILTTSIEKHYRSFHDAFVKVIGSGRVLSLFHAGELMSVIIGNENYDWDAFENVAEYKGEYASSHPTIQLFWEVFHELPEVDKKKFLLFLTGSDRIPIQGMKAIKIIIQPAGDERFLPVAHTCFNLLDLPRYSTKERLRYKLIQAIQYNQGFHIV